MRLACTFLSDCLNLFQRDVLSRPFPCRLICYWLQGLELGCLDGHDR